MRFLFRRAEQKRLWKFEPAGESRTGIRRGWFGLAKTIIDWKIAGSARGRVRSVTRCADYRRAGPGARRVCTTPGAGERPGSASITPLHFPLSLLQAAHPFGV